MKKVANKNTLIISFLTLRRIIGILGLALPIVLLAGSWAIFQTGIQHSISNYYYTGMRDVFVGTMCAIGVFLLSYKGYEKIEDIAGNLGCLFAVGVALFPTTPEGAAQNIAGTFHLIFAVLFFVTLIYFALFQFTKTNPNREETIQKVQRNLVYRICGGVMAVCVVLLFVVFLLPNQEMINTYNLIYWLESLAVWAFGFSWLVKGETLWKDEE